MLDSARILLRKKYFSFSFQSLWIWKFGRAILNLAPRGHVPEENWFSLPRSHQLPTAPESVVRLHEPLPIHAGFWLVWSWVTLVHAVTVAMSLCIQWPCHVQQKLFWCMHPLLWLLQSSHDSPEMSLGRLGYVLDVPFRADHSIPLLLAHWPVVDLFTDHQLPQKEAPVWALIDALSVSIKIKP